MAARAGACSPLDSDGLFNEMQARKNWPSGGPPAVFDLRPADAYAKQHVRGAFHATVSPDDGELTVAGGSGWFDKAVCVYDETAESLDDHPVVVKLRADARARRVYFLTETYEAFHARYPFLCARGSSSSAMKRPPAYPSCIIPGLLYLGDLEDAAALPRLREHLNIRHAVTALADPPQSLKASVAEAKVDHTWCNVRDVEGGDIKEHFDKAIGAIERGSAKGHAVFVHCSRGVSRSASLCIAYLMKARKMSAADARELVVGRRAIVLPNDGFWRCLQEYEKELTGERSGVYVPAKTKRLEEFEVEIPPAWAAPPSVAYAKLSIVKDGEEIDEVDVGEHTSYTFGRSLTCDFPLEHPSVSRQHALIVHHENGGVYAIDMKSSHGSFVNGKQLKPYEACRLRGGAEVRFGASSRHYRLRIPAEGGQSTAGKRAPPAEPADEPRPSAGPSANSSAEWAEPEEEHKKKKKRKREPKYMSKQEKKKRRWLNGPQSRSKMSENERVAMGAGAGSGCFGPGFD